MVPVSRVTCWMVPWRTSNHHATMCGSYNRSPIWSYDTMATSAHVGSHQLGEFAFTKLVNKVEIVDQSHVYDPSNIRSTVQTPFQNNFRTGRSSRRFSMTARLQGLKCLAFVPLDTLHMPIGKCKLGHGNRHDKCILLFRPPTSPGCLCRSFRLQWQWPAAGHPTSPRAGAALQRTPGLGAALPAAPHGRGATGRGSTRGRW